jgi:hypothetical protein
VRLYGNIALVTTKVKTSGTFQGKPFDVMERQTDVLLWKAGDGADSGRVFSDRPALLECNRSHTCGG